jgi:Skp family chaperone for outer membrane proteins
VRQELGRATDAGTRAKLEQEEAQRRAEFERAVAQAQQDIQNAQRQISNDLMAKVRPILEELVAGTDVQIVLQADGPVLWAAPGLDLTPVVVERLNAEPEPAKSQG